MAQYVDGYILPLPKKNVASYRRMAKAASKVWMDHGAVEYRECIGDELAIKGMMPFGKTVQAKSGETVVFAWVVFKSKADRNKVNAKVMKDPRLLAMMDPKKMPFDVKRMGYGGFKVMVEG